MALFQGSPSRGEPLAMARGRAPNPRPRPRGEPLLMARGRAPRTLSSARPAPSPAPRAPQTFSAQAPSGPSPSQVAAQQQQQAVARQRQLDQLRASIRATPLDPSLIAQFAARQRGARRAVQEAEIAGERGKSRAKVDFDQFMRQLGERTDTAMGDLRGEAAARNLAFQPAFVGVGMRDIRDEAAGLEGQAVDARTQFLAGIERQINSAQQSRDSELAAVARDRARAQADHRQWIQTQLSALA